MKISITKKIFNEFKVIKDDFKSFSLTAKLIIFILGCIAVFNSFFDFSTGKFGIGDGTTFFQVMKVLNGLGAFAGVITVALVTKKKVSTFYWSYIYIPIYALYCASIKLWAVFQIQMFFFLPCSIAGLFIWKKNMKSHNQEVSTTPFYWVETILFLIFCVVVGFVVFYEFREINYLAGNTNITFHQSVFDAITSCLLMTGQVVQLRRKNFTMITWLIADFGMLLSAIVPFAAGWIAEIDYNVLIMTSIFVLLAIYGIFRWNILPLLKNKIHKKKTN